MGARRTMEIAAPPEATQHGRKLTAAEKKEILRLHDLPATVAEISREVGVPIDMVRKVLTETFPVDVNRWPM